jgi:hypothetical protein
MSDNDKRDDGYVNLKNRFIYLSGGRNFKFSDEHNFHRLYIYSDNGNYSGDMLLNDKMLDMSDDGLRKIIELIINNLDRIAFPERTNRQIQALVDVHKYTSSVSSKQLHH